MPKEMNGKILVERECATLQILPDPAMSLDRITDNYDVDLNEGEPEAYHVTMPPQFHIYYKTEKATSHTLMVRYEVEKKENK